MPSGSWRSAFARKHRSRLKIFLRKQLAFYQERKVRPPRADNPTRLTMVLLSRHFDWRNALTVVQPKTLLAWHRKGFRLFWRWKSNCGRPPIPSDLQQLIRTMARENPSWGEERIANELLLKLGLRVSPRTVRKYLPKSPPSPPGQPRGDQHWATFLKNHARFIVACDFCVAVTATFRFLYVFVALEHASRRVLRLSATAHPTAAWTLQQLRETIPSDDKYRFIIHDHDSMFSAEVRWLSTNTDRDLCAGRPFPPFAAIGVDRGAEVANGGQPWPTVARIS